MKKNILEISVFLLSVTAVFASCDSLDTVQKQWTDSPEQIYVGKLDSLKTRSGINRIEIIGNTNYIRTAKTCRIEYSDKTLEFAISDIIKEDGKAHILLDGLNAGSYYFYVTTFDEDGNRSIRSEVYGTIYGKSDLSYIQPYSVASIVPRMENGPAEIYWNQIGSTYFYNAYLEFTYEDAEGTSHNMTVKADEDGVFPSRTLVRSWKPGSAISVRSYVQRDETDLDVFELPVSESAFPEDIKWAAPLFDDGSKADLGPSHNYNIADEYTIELMMRCSEIQPKDGCVISSTKDGTCMLLRTSHNKLEHYIQNTSWNWNCIAYEGIEAGRWYHVAVTYKADTRYTIYLDGELVAEGNNCGSLKTEGDGNRLVIGVRSDYTADYMKGNVQHVSIWEYERTGEQIKEDMKFNFDEDTEGLLAYWPMTVEPSGPIADITGNHTMTFSNVKWPLLEK